VVEGRHGKDKYWRNGVDVDDVDRYRHLSERYCQALPFGWQSNQI
jgi:hypothetical protein